jgi:integrase
VKTPTVPQKPRTIITPEQFGRVLEALPNDTMRLLAETKIETGLRWGELTELRMSDIDLVTRMLTASRAVVEVNAKFHPDGGRFLVKNYPKDGEYRRIKLTNLTNSGHMPVITAWPTMSSSSPCRPRNQC